MSARLDIDNVVINSLHPRCGTLSLISELMRKLHVISATDFNMFHSCHVYTFLPQTTMSQSRLSVTRRYCVEKANM